MSFCIDKGVCVQTYQRLKDQKHDRSSHFSNEDDQNNDEELRRERFFLISKIIFLFSKHILIDQK